MIVKKNSEKEIVRGIFKALVARKKMVPAICSIVKEFDGPLHDLKSYYEGRMYKHLCYKFRPWICLQQLDLSATVSFRAYDAVSKIEFCEEPNGAKYKRGLLYSRHKLTKLCQQLEVTRFFPEIDLEFKATCTFRLMLRICLNKVDGKQLGKTAGNAMEGKLSKVFPCSIIIIEDLKQEETR